MLLRENQQKVYKNILDKATFNKDLPDLYVGSVVKLAKKKRKFGRATCHKSW